MKRIVTVIVAALWWSGQAMSLDQNHDEWARVLKAYLSADGSVRYRDLKRAAKDDPDHPFTRYVRSIQQVKRKEFDLWSTDDQKAFLINAYNALTIQLILDNYPVKSIRDIGGLFSKPWDVKFFTLLDGAANTLDPIEHSLLRPMYKDFRVHAALNCASLSCPPLRAESYIGIHLNAQLDDQMRRWLLDPTRNLLDSPDGKIKISKIFDWYKSDFDSWGGGVAKVLETFAPPAIKPAIRRNQNFQYLDYDWNLNEAK